MRDNSENKNLHSVDGKGKGRKHLGWVLDDICWASELINLETIYPAIIYLLFKLMIYLKK